jgi:uncharacterized protein YbjT (DUF2867 family)
MQRILVAGATGRLGRPVAMHLQRTGYRVRALTRRPERCDDLRELGIEVIAADVSVAEGLSTICEDCDAVYISLRGQDDVASYLRSEVGGVRNLLQAARSAGVGRVAYLSGAGRSAGNERHFPVRVKTECERLLQTGGVPYTIFRATHFMESLPMFVRGRRAEIPGRQPHRYHYIAVDDYARMVARSFSEPAAAGRIFVILGPQPYTMHEALRIYLDRTHPDMRIATVPIPVLRLVARMTANRELRFVTDLFAAFAALGEEGDPAPANSLLGKPVTTLEDWSSRQT